MKKLETFKESSPEKVFAYLGELVKQLDQVFGRHQYMLIGSYTRDIYLTVMAGKEPYRSTQDVDFSALVVSEEKFLEQLSKVGRQSGGKDSHHVTCRVVDGQEIDILPFSEDFKDGIFRFQESEWDVTGHAEAYQHSVIFTLNEAEGISVRIPKIEAMLVLKIIAWGMRGNHGVHKDAQDFQFLLGAGAELIQKEDNPFQKYEEVLDLYDWDLNCAFAHVLGQRARASMGERVLMRCSEVLESEDGIRDFYDAAVSRHIYLPADAYEKYRSFLHGIGLAESRG